MDEAKLLPPFQKKKKPQSYSIIKKLHVKDFIGENTVVRDRYCSQADL
jgi:hypothetical protein